MAKSHSSRIPFARFVLHEKVPGKPVGRLNTRKESTAGRFTTVIEPEKLKLAFELREGEVPLVDFKVTNDSSEHQTEISMPEQGKSLKEHMNPGIWKFRLSLHSRIKERLNEIAEIISKMHSHSIVHGHPHLGNFLLHEGHVKLSDFKLLEKKEINWSSVDSIFNAFKREYEMIFSPFHADERLEGIFFTAKGKPRFGKETKKLMAEFIKGIVNGFPDSLLLHGKKALLRLKIARNFGIHEDLMFPERNQRENHAKIK